MSSKIAAMSTLWSLSLSVTGIRVNGVQDWLREHVCRLSEDDDMAVISIANLNWWYYVDPFPMRVFLPTPRLPSSHDGQLQLEPACVCYSIRYLCILGVHIHLSLVSARHNAMSSEKFDLYPSYAYKKSHTFDKWVKITCADVHQLRDGRGQDGG